MTISDRYGASTLSAQPGLQVSALPAADLQSLLTSTASHLEAGNAVNDTTLQYALLVTNEVSHLPAIGQDPLLTGNQTAADPPHDLSAALAL